jgi:glycosyltransferase involved in cell wall biosynthesis
VTSGATTSRPPDASPPISVIVLTLNEEGNIADCLRSCAWADDVHVLDSGSTDRTCEIARAMGATVHVNAFTSFGQQRNWAIDNIACKHAWHFHLDADERFLAPLVAEMLREIGPDGTRSRYDGYLVPSKMIFMERWIRYSSGYPTFQVRLFHRDRCRFADFGHGQREVCRQVGRLKSPYVHYNFSKGLNEWLLKHNGYSDRESAEGVEIRHRARPALRELRGADPTLTRRVMKNLSYFFPGRGILRFVFLYFLRLGFLDGTAGLHYCAMIGMYDHWTELKIRERERPWAAATDALARQLLVERQA